MSDHIARDEGSGRPGDVETLRAQVEQLELELARRHRLATLGTIAGSIAHEFNNILTPVLSYAQLALAAPHDAELAKKALRKTVEGTERAAKIANSLLGFVRPDDGTSGADVASVINETIACLARHPEKDGIKVSVHADRSHRVAMDSVDLHQVLLNLVLNAIEAIKPQRGEIQITCDEVECSTWNTGSGATGPAGASPQRIVQIVVRDSGRGMPAVVQELLFEPFFTTASERSADRGTGLGLTICQRLVQKADGEISVASEPGLGTEFSILLPALHESVAPSRTPSRAA